MVYVFGEQDKTAVGGMYRKRGWRIRHLVQQNKIDHISEFGLYAD